MLILYIIGYICVGIFIVKIAATFCAFQEGEGFIALVMVILWPMAVGAFLLIAILYLWQKIYDSNFMSKIDYYLRKFFN